MDISNEQKAREIGKKYQTPCHGHGDCEFESYQSAFEAMQWKDEEHAKEKQEWIDEACEWIKEHNGDYISIVPNDHLTNNFYDDLRKAMKGE